MQSQKWQFWMHAFNWHGIIEIIDNSVASIQPPVTDASENQLCRWGTDHVAAAKRYHCMDAHIGAAVAVPGAVATMVYATIVGATAPPKRCHPQPVTNSVEDWRLQLLLLSQWRLSCIATSVDCSAPAIVATFADADAAAVGVADASTVSADRNSPWQLCLAAADSNCCNCCRWAVFATSLAPTWNDACQAHY